MTRPDGEAPTVPEPVQTHNLNVASLLPLIGPAELAEQVPVTDAAQQTVVTARQEVKRVLSGDDPRLLVVVGPCSIHDVDAAMDYAGKLATLRKKLAERMCIVMRVYFEKPRTTLGWKGLINDPNLDGSFDMDRGIRLARELLMRVNELGLPAGTEFLEPITPQYIADLVTWAAIGARTTESQTHRQMASGLSMPVGYKNGTDGNLQVAIDAMLAAQSGHHFLGIDDHGRTCVVHTRGNPWGHAILRGGRGTPNYHPENVADAARRLGDAGLNPGVMIDCSHANSDKQHERQEAVFKSLIDQRVARAKGAIAAGATPPRPFITGAMIESNLAQGNQKLPTVQPGEEVRGKLAYGVSITDACLGWDKTAEILEAGYERLGELE
ncbi:MAG: 3-deoxy-7-phosphoheptulonate synthase [Planctomycetota bacterium]